MNLAMRFLARSLSYSPNILLFKCGKDYFYSYADFIDYVLERFARRFGRISNDDAAKFQNKLAMKYCDGHHATLNKLSRRYECGFAYPRELARELSMNAFVMKLELESLYHYPDEMYCPIPNNPKYSLTCCFCGSKLFCEVKPKNGNNYDINLGVHIYRSYVCKSKKCRAIAGIYRKNQRAEVKLIDVILGVVKNEGENPQFIQLRKHFI